MERDVKKIVADNLVKLRKSKDMTQGDLAKVLSYSDKTISKWEHADSLPDIAVLSEIAEFYGVTLNDLTSENAIENVQKQNTFDYNYAIISCLIATAVFLIATIVFVYCHIIFDENVWTAFVWAVPASAATLLLFNRHSRRKNKVLAASLNSVLLWSCLMAFYLQFLNLQLWLIFLIGVPVQLIIIFLTQLKN